MGKRFVAEDELSCSTFLDSLKSLDLEDYNRVMSNAIQATAKKMVSSANALVSWPCWWHHLLDFVTTLLRLYLKSLSAVVATIAPTNSNFKIDFKGSRRNFPMMKLQNLASL